VDDGVAAFHCGEDGGEGGHVSLDVGEVLAEGGRRRGWGFNVEGDYGVGSVEEDMDETGSNLSACLDIDVN
jgi:hypothetical protein